MKCSSPSSTSRKTFRWITNSTQHYSENRKTYNIMIGSKLTPNIFCTNCWHFMRRFYRVTRVFFICYVYYISISIFKWLNSSKFTHENYFETVKQLYFPIYSFVYDDLYHFVILRYWYNATIEQLKMYSSFTESYSSPLFYRI